jgi:transcriptional regulator with XRE-family HTH domain
MNMDRHTRAAIARNVKKLRERAKLSQEKLGQRAVLAQTAISYIENPEGKSPSVDTLEAVAAALRVPAWTLMLPDAGEHPEALSNLNRLVTTYTNISDQGRRTVDAIAEAEARYASLPEKT